LNRLLLHDACAPGPRQDIFLDKGADSEEKDEKEDESEDGEVDDQSKEKRKSRARTRERVMEEWAKLPLLNEEKSGVSAAWFDDVCEVEVGRWLEG
jgi:hypothetical protein